MCETSSTSAIWVKGYTFEIRLPNNRNDNLISTTYDSSNAAKLSPKDCEPKTSNSTECDSNGKVKNSTHIPHDGIPQEETTNVLDERLLANDMKKRGRRAFILPTRRFSNNLEITQYTILLRGIFLQFDVLSDNIGFNANLPEVSIVFSKKTRFFLCASTFNGRREAVAALSASWCNPTPTFRFLMKNIGLFTKNQIFFGNFHYKSRNSLSNKIMVLGLKFCGIQMEPSAQLTSFAIDFVRKLRNPENNSELKQ